MEQTSIDVPAVQAGSWRRAQAKLAEAAISGRPATIDPRDALALLRWCNDRQAAEQVDKPWS